MTERKRVVVAMSGGVDSSIAAALLKEQGYDVIGVTMQIWPAAKEEVEGGCCSISAVDDARRVANALDIPYYVLNFQDLFQEKVIDYFVDEYLAGATPNPCIACNKFIKFEALLSKAKGLGADYIATGHYARIEYDQEKDRYLLLKAVDEHKDQSYTLAGLTQYQLAHTLFPLGNFTKEETRAKAEELGLAVAHKPDSQEICFVTDNDYKNFLMENAPQEIKPGPFLDLEGNVLGQHEGLPFYTVGQRKGLGIALGYPAYVVRLDPERNAVILGRADDVFGLELLAKDNNFIYIDKLTEPMEVTAKIRYAAPPAGAVIYPEEKGQVRAVFHGPQRAITPGQTIVYYLGEYVLGGGVIVKQLR